MKICYKSKSFINSHLVVINRANDIIREYQADGYDITLRQLYYQFVARDLFPSHWAVQLVPGQWTMNHERNYNKLGTVISDARMAGMIDWNAIVDRTRSLSEWHHDKSPAGAVESALDRYALDYWANQPYRVELWVEKEALGAIFRQACMPWDIPVLSCKGYMSQSAQWSAHQRILKYWDEGKDVKILHFGDHDPSGVNMTEDNSDRLDLFNDKYNWGDGDFELIRLALNMDQVGTYPPSPAKDTDSRTKAYVKKYGKDAWELDALPPDVLSKIVDDNVKKLIDWSAWVATETQEKLDKERLRAISEELTEEENS